MADMLAMILAGGEGRRLKPLTDSRSKPAVPFCGSYRLIDFALNNFVNADLLKIYILTQFKSQSLYLHLKQGWNITGLTNRFIDPIPAQMRMGKRWYDGTADAIYQNMRFIELINPEHVCIFGSDHIYKMDVRQMVDFHQKKHASMTIAAIKMPTHMAHEFGVIEVNKQNKMIGFEEKPSQPKALPDDPNFALVSMGNYIFETQCLYRTLTQDALNNTSTHDFGRDVIPKLFNQEDVYVYDFSHNQIPGEAHTTYWRDVGTLSAYWQAHMDILSDNPPFTLFNPKWPLHTHYPPLPPAIFIDAKHRQAQVTNTLVSAGCYIHSGTLYKTSMGFNCQIEENTQVFESVLLGDIKIGAHCHISRAIIDKNVEIAPHTIIGEDLEHDKQRFTVLDNHIVVIPKGARIGY